MQRTYETCAASRLAVLALLAGFCAIAPLGAQPGNGARGFNSRITSLTVGRSVATAAGIICMTILLHTGFTSRMARGWT